MKEIAHVFIWAFVVLLVLTLFFQWSDCTDSGGVLVRGLIRFECMQR